MPPDQAPAALSADLNAAPGGTGGLPVLSEESSATAGKLSLLTSILWLIAVVLVIFGVVSLVRGRIVPGIVLIIVGLLVGPGGVSIFSK